MAKLPYETTKVPVSRTQGEIRDMLYSVGFNQIAQVTDKFGKGIIIAEYGEPGKTASFKFEAHIDILNKQVSNKEKSSRIAWRMVFYQVKSVCDAVKCGVVTLSEAFGGNMLLSDESGNLIKVSEFVSLGIETGTLSTKSITSQFLLENKADQ